jgi:hypothetical protein
MGSRFYAEPLWKDLPALGSNNEPTELGPGLCKAQAKGAPGWPFPTLRDR